MDRFSGTVEYLCDVEVGSIVEWITAIDFADWPQQTPIDDGLRPAMVKDPFWHGFAAAVAPVIAAVNLSGAPANVMLTVVMPGHDIPTHTDAQPPNWLCRVHVPLTTNDVSRFVVGGESHHMEVGKAYLVNTEAEHSVANDGDTPRRHLMWDVLAAN
jgi:hypothetical protein